MEAGRLCHLRIFLQMIGNTKESVDMMRGNRQTPIGSNDKFYIVSGGADNTPWYGKWRKHSIFPVVFLPKEYDLVQYEETTWDLVKEEKAGKHRTVQFGGEPADMVGDNWQGREFLKGSRLWKAGEPHWDKWQNLNWVCYWTLISCMLVSGLEARMTAC